MTKNYGSDVLISKPAGKGPGKGSIMRFYRSCIVAVLIFLLSVAADMNTAIADCEGGSRLLGRSEKKEVLEKLGKIKASTKTFQADFSEERSTASLKVPLHFEGRIYFDSEGLFAMQYTKPLKYILWVKGREAIFYVEGSTTADIVDLSNMGDAAKHVGFFNWEPGNFKGRIWECDKAYRLEDSSKNEKEGGGRRTLTIFIERSTLHMERLIIEDEYGDLTQITLYNLKMNEKLPSSVRYFSLPEGTKHNRLGQPK